MRSQTTQISARGSYQQHLKHIGQNEKALDTYSVKHTTNDEIDPAEFFDGFGNSILKCFWLPDIGLHGQANTTSVLGQFLRGLTQTVESVEPV